MYEQKLKYALEETRFGSFKEIILIADKKSHLKKYLKCRGYHFNKKIKRWIKGRLRKDLTDEIQIISLPYLTSGQFKKNIIKKQS